MQLPTPVHGVSTMNEIILEHLQSQAIFDLEVIPLKFAKNFDELRKISFSKLFLLIRIFFQIKYALKHFKPDLVYFSFMPVGIGFIRDYFYLKIIKRYSVKIVLHLHNRGIYESSKNPIFKILYQSTFQDITLVHVSDTLIHEELRNLKVKNCKQVGIPNTCRSFPEMVNNSNKKTMDVLFCSNIFPEKGYRIALEAIKIVSKNHKLVRLIICGQPLRKRYEREIHRFIKRFNLEDNIYYKGPVFGEEKIKTFNEADIFIFPSYFNEECFPVVILEAMAAGIPIIATNVGVINEVIDNGINGIIIQPKKNKELIDSLINLIENNGLRLSFGKKAHEKYLVNYNPDKFHKGIDNIIT